MTRIQLDLRDDLKAKAEVRAAETGHANVQEYLESLIEADAEGADFGAPDHLKVQDEDQLERLLLERLNDPRPTSDATPKFWQNLKDRAARRRDDRGAERP